MYTPGRGTNTSVRGRQPPSQAAQLGDSMAGAPSRTPCGGYRLWELSHGHAVAVTGDFFIPTNYFQEVQGQWHRELW